MVFRRGRRWAASACSVCGPGHAPPKALTVADPAAVRGDFVAIRRQRQHERARPRLDQLDTVSRGEGDLPLRAATTEPSDTERERERLAPGEKQDTRGDARSRRRRRPSRKGCLARGPRRPSTGSRRTEPPRPGSCTSLRGVRGLVSRVQATRGMTKVSTRLSIRWARRRRPWPAGPCGAACCS